MFNTEIPRGGYGLEACEAYVIAGAHILDGVPQTNYELTDGASESIDAYCEMFNSANHTADGCFFSFEGDKAGRKLASAAIEAAGRGVKVRMIINNFGHFNLGDNWRIPGMVDYKRRAKDRDEVIQAMTDGGVDVHRSRLDLPGLAWTGRRYGRGHEKFVATDTGHPGQSVRFGSVEPTDHNAQWNDFTIRVTGDGETNEVMQEHFNRLWYGSSHYRGGVLSVKGNTRDNVVVADVPGIGSILPLAVEIIDRAEQFAIVESPYLRSEIIRQALGRAAARGVESSIIIPANNHRKIGVLTSRMRDEFVNAGVNVYEFWSNNGMTHARGVATELWAATTSCAFNSITSSWLGEIAMASPNPDFSDLVRGKLESDKKNSILYLPI